jgi:outer membrane receptor protein involved in Fe transport
MKNLFFFLFFTFLCISITVAQSVKLGKLTGFLADSTTAKPVPFATVALIDNQPGNSEKLITGTTTDGAGAFVMPGIPLGQYRLRFSFVGYRTKTLPVAITTETPGQDLGVIKLAPEGKNLGEVTITAQKALIEDKGDRLVYNAEKDISNAGGTAADVLRKVPMLTVDVSGNVKMRGSGNIKVLINGKPSAMMARNLADALKQMPANTIKSVEVITSPGAKYDAEGSAGIINIITKKALQGFNGSVNAAAGDFDRVYRSVGTNLSLRKKKIGASISLNTNQFQQIMSNTMTRTTLVDGRPVNTLSQQSLSDNTATAGNGQMSIDYDPDSLNRINFSADVWGGDFPNNSQITNRLTATDGTILQQFRTDAQFRNPYGNGQLDLGYTKTFLKKPGINDSREFSVLMQYSRMPDNYFYNTDRYSTTETLLFRQRSTNYSRNKEFTFQTDYTHPFIVRSPRDTTTIKLDIGAKAISRDIGSEFRVDESADGSSAFVPNAALSNDFGYTQRVISGYTALSFSNRHKWNLNAGARLEQTLITGDFKTTQTQLDTRYRNLIPSVTLSKGIGISTLKISYTQRIQRPQIWNLNPWVNQSDPKNIVTGNPYLNPELSHATELGHNLNTKAGISINSALYWRQTNNSIEYLSTVDANGVSTTSPQNVGKSGVYGLNVNLSGEIVKKLNVNIGTEIQYVDIRSVALGQQNTGWVGSLNTNFTYKITPITTLQVNSYVSTGDVSLQRKNSGWYFYQVSGKREFWDKKASLTLRVTNPFGRDVVMTSKQNAPTFTTVSTMNYVNRQVQLAFEWRFGQMSSGGGKESKKIRNDDRGGR